MVFFKSDFGSLREFLGVDNNKKTVEVKCQMSKVKCIPTFLVVTENSCQFLANEQRSLNHNLSTILTVPDHEINFW